MSLNDWIKLDVGGRLIETTRLTLVACPDSKLANMFTLESSWPADAVSPDEAFKIDADPNVFEILLNWLRRKKLMMTHGTSLESVAVEAEFFGLIDLKEAVEEHKKLTLTKTVRVLDNTQKGIIEEMEEVLNFLKNVQIQNEDLNVIKKPWDDLQSSLKYIPIGQHFNILPAEIKTNIMSYLYDLNALHAASVCQEWKGMLRNSWGILKSGPKNLKYVDPGVLARALNEVEEVEIDEVEIEDYNRVTSEQITEFFAHLSVQDTKLKELKFCEVDLSHVNTDNLLKAINKLEKVTLSYASLSTQQLNGIIRHIANKETKIKELWLDGNDLSLINTDDLAAAVNKLERVSLHFASLSTQQLNGIFRHIVDKETKLKLLRLAYNDLSGVEEDLLNRAKNKLSQWTFWC